MIRKSFHYWLAALLLGPTCALALEIGEIQVNSALNQLFDARIALPALTPEELGKISVKLAGPPMFKEFGLDRSPALANLVFAIEYNAEDQVYVRVVSTQPIREPSLALLLEFGWPRGKTFREFTVFLDPVQRLVKRPGGRTKTVMETPASVVYGPESAAAPPAPESNPSPPTALAAVSETAAPPVEWATPAGASAPLPSPEPVKTYQPGDSYRVLSGDGLWGIALKTRPDPDITRDQMMQALFRANPQAFSKAGINGLKIGATLRIPTLREIADWTGSPVAKRLAEKELAPADTVKPDVKPVPVQSEPVVAADGPEVFPLPAVATPLPEPVAAAPLPESVKPESEVKPEPEAARAAPEPAPASLPEPASEPASVATATPEPEPVTESVLPVTASAPATAATGPAVATVEEELSTQMLEPVSATPLLFLAIVEMMTTFAEIPAAIPVKMLAVAPPAISEPAEVTTTDAQAPPVIEPASPAVEAPPEAATTSPVAQAPLVIEPASPAVEAPPEAAMTSPAVEAPPMIEPASPVAEAPSPAIAEPVAPIVYRGGDQYGPVSANEHLWSIATKVRPDPAIGKDVMMSALFMVNPQAFSKPGDMNSLKVGVMLRVPTLKQLVDLTGSKVARRLLESGREPAAEPALPAPSRATPPDR